MSAAVAAAGTGGAAAVASSKKTVTLSVDGEERQVSSFADTVGDLLDSEGVDVTARDAVAPAESSDIRDGARVAVRFSRPLDLTVDGGSREVWVTALSVGSALSQLGVRESGALVSASRSKRIPRDGMDLEVRTPHKVVFVTKKARHPVTTTASTMRDALADAGLRLRAHDRLSAPLAAYPSDGQVVRLTRVTVKTVTKRVTVAHRTFRRSTSEMYEGSTRVTQAGDNGRQVKRLRVTVVDGKRTKQRVLSTRWIDKPNRRVVLVGSASRPASSSGGGGGGSYSPSSDGLNWAALAECESGGDPQAYNPAGPYYGLYQFSLSTWQSVGGSGLPTEASSGEQTYRAQLLYQQSGAGQWPVCGSRL
ncbi:MAG: ubiquitin-like domain-containing protein [Actinomycetes bacterium]